MKSIFFYIVSVLLFFYTSVLHAEPQSYAIIHNFYREVCQLCRANGCSILLNHGNVVVHVDKPHFDESRYSVNYNDEICWKQYKVNLYSCSSDKWSYVAQTYYETESRKLDVVRGRQNGKPIYFLQSLSGEKCKVCEEQNCYSENFGNPGLCVQ